ncbi:RDD family protein [Luteimonas terricola]|uniref:RDD domain-containing protein n=1 Tax=Luteimonas terricola TaxID=645597 RepID=A0ABQ2E8L4_9GAMM|nr:RDD family protein [Luteimonas terricola]GGJ97343.1 hypothetical protein GCM10011394_02820 [Luteimonas terricola]
MQSTQHTEDVVYAGFWRRWAALFIDQLILGVGFYGTLFAVAILVGIAGGMEWIETLDSGDANPAVMVAYIGFVLLYYVAAALYFSLFESSRHQATPGKMALGIKVVDQHGQRLSFGHALGRWVAATLSYLTLYIGFLMAAFTERKRALHDMVAGTLVVDRWAFSEHPERQRRDLGGCLIAAILVVVLMFGIAILGILAAIALPAYQDYLQRSRVMQAMTDTAPLKTMVADFRTAEGRCPFNGEGGIGPEESIGGTLASRVVVGSFDDGSCGIEQELGNTGHPDLDGGTIWWQLDLDDARWHCSSDIRDAWLPQECRG